MPIQKQNLEVPFGGLDQKNDPFKLQPGKFEVLENTVPIKGGQTGILLQKRNGFGSLPSLSDATNTYLATFNGNLTAIGTSLNAFSNGSQSWVNKGTIAPMDIDTLSLIKNNTNQSQCDSAVASNDLLCVVYTDVTPSGTLYRYAVQDSVTGQNIIAPTSFTATGSPRVFVMLNYFMVVYPNGANLTYIAITINDPTTISSPVSIASTLSFSSTNNFDGYVTNDSLYLAWNATDGGGAIRAVYITSTLTIVTPVVFAGKVATIMSVTADDTVNPSVVWITFYDSVSQLGYSIALDQQLNTILAPTLVISAIAVVNITSSAQNSIRYMFYEQSNAYGYTPFLPTNIVWQRTCDINAVQNTATRIERSVGLASKSFIVSGLIYMLTAYQSPFQPTYFLIDSSGNVVSKLAYSNGLGYLVLGLPSVTVIDTIAQVSYLFKDSVEALSKTDTSSSGGIYAQSGINQASVNFTTDNLITTEIGGNLNLSGGFVWAYDGYVPVEQGFHLWPDSVTVTTSGAGGSISAQQYYYQVTYEWADNQGNIFRSAPSIPVGIVTIGATSSNTINVPTLRLTYKTANPVKIVIYRWSTAQQVYYQVTSVTVPTLNSVSVDSIAFVDTLADASILGNNILYTTGGVIENIAPPATSIMTLFKSRLFLVDAEDQNLLWFSKQVIEATPVEMSDLLTIYVGPTVSAQGNTGPITALSSMDDKLIVFKKNAIYYIVGQGPDNTGANNDFQDPIFITATIGCTNQNSIVFIPSGLLFQSDKGIWLLGRDLSTTYIGAPVDNFNDILVKSALVIPGTNQARLILDGGTILMYDYYFNQWGTFVGSTPISSTLYQSLQTNISVLGEVFQETPGVYLDGTRPVNMGLTTGWFNLAGLQGYERAYFFYLLGTYLSPHKLSIQIAFDYNSSPSQIVTINPINFSSTYGGDSLYGGSSVHGGPSNIEQWRVFFQTQKCEAFQITIQESYDPSFGVPAGAGLTLSGLDLILGMKSAYPRLKSSVSIG